MTEATPNLDPYEAAEISWRYSLAKYAHTRSQGKWLPYPHVRELANFLMRIALKRDGRGIVNAPPRHCKSDTGSAWLPSFFLEWFPSKRVILSSYGGELATEFSEKARDQIREAENCWTQVKADSDAASNWKTTAGGGMRATGVGGPITGMGGDLMLVDDPHKSWLEAHSPNIRKKIIAWFNATFYTRKEPGASIIVSMTRWHVKDLTGYLVDEHKDDWEVFNMPALAEEGDMLGREVGEALCPWRFTREELLAIRKAVGPVIWAGLYQQRPVPEGGNIIQTDWVKHWRILKPKGMTFIQSWDMNFKDSGRSRVAGHLWARKGADWFLVDRVIGNWDYTRTEREVFERSKPSPSGWLWHKARSKLVEDKANGPAIISALKSKVGGLTPVNPRGSKEARLAATAPMWESGNIWLPDPAICPWSAEVELEIVTFPHSEFDDDTDACSQVLQRGSSAITVLENLSRW